MINVITRVMFENPIEAVLIEHHNIIKFVLWLTLEEMDMCYVSAISYNET